MRGALSLVLALVLPLPTPRRGLLIIIVYGVVLTTLSGQGFAFRADVPFVLVRERGYSIGAW
jgi:NhaP-type Na+/H+ or K+/H+ antiporter